MRLSAEAAVVLIAGVMLLSPLALTACAPPSGTPAEYWTVENNRAHERTGSRLYRRLNDKPDEFGVVCYGSSGAGISCVKVQ